MISSGGDGRARDGSGGQRYPSYVFSTLFPIRLCFPSLIQCLIDFKVTPYLSDISLHSTLVAICCLVPWCYHSYSLGIPLDLVFYRTALILVFQHRICCPQAIVFSFFTHWTLPQPDKTLQVLDFYFSLFSFLLRFYTPSFPLFSCQQSLLAPLFHMPVET